MQAVKADGSYMEAKELTGVLARLTRAIRLFVLTEIHASIEEDHAAEFGPLPSPDHRFTPTAGDQVDKARALLRWVQEDNLSTFAAIRSCQHYATSLAESALGMPSIWWVDSQNHTEMLVRGHRLSLDHLRTIVANLQKKIEKSFRFLTAGLPTDIDYDALNDDLRNNTNGYSVVDLLWRKSSDQFIDFAQRLLEDPGLGLTRHMSGELAMNPTRAWLEALARHELLILVYIQFTSGGPARGTELVGLLMRNIPTRLRSLYVFGRRVCLVRRYNKTSSIQEHDKVIPVSLDGFIGDVMLRTFAYCRPPAEFFMEKLFPSGGREAARLYRDLCFTGFGRCFTSDDLSNAMGAESFSVVQFELKLALFRQSYSAFNQALVPGFNEDGEPDDDDDMETIDALQAGHTPDIARRFYGLAHNAFEGTTMTSTHLNLRNSDRWQIILHLQPGGRGSPYFDALLSNPQPTPVPDAQAALPTTVNQLAQLLTSQMAGVTSLVQALMQQNDNLRVEIVDLRAQISSRIASGASASSAITPAPSPSPGPQQTLVHAIEADVMQSDPVESAPIEASIPNASLAQEDAMSISSGMQVIPPPPTAAPLIPADVRMRRRNSDASMASVSPADAGEANQLTAFAYPSEKVKAYFSSGRRLFPFNEALEFLNVPAYPDQFAIPPNDAAWLLRRLLRNPNAQWNSDEQVAAIIAMVRSDRDLCIIVRTGGGKSLIAVIPSFVEDGVTIIVVPFCALLRDWVRRLKDQSVPFEIFENSKSHLTGTKKIILVSVDVARLAGWRDALLRLQERGVLFLRIVIDEAHVVLTSSDFRVSLREMHEVRFVNVPVVLMSATMPPNAIPFFTQEYGLYRPLVIRGLTDRPEIRYDVLTPMDLPATASLLRQLAHQHITNGNPEDRYFAFVFSLQKGRELGRLTELPFYHGESDDINHPMTARQQVAIYDNWVDGKPPGLIATEALGAGTDYPHARFALILHPPANLVTLIQLIGRLCRDGRPGFVYIIPSPALPPPCSTNEVETLQGSLVMHQILYAMPNWPAYHWNRCIRLAILSGNDGVRLSCYEIADAQLCRFCQEHVATLTPDEFEWLGISAYSDNGPPPLRPVILRDHAPNMSTTELKQRLNEQFGPLVAASEERTRSRTMEELERLRRYQAMLLYPHSDVCGYCMVYDLLGLLDFEHEDFKHDIGKCKNVRDLDGYFKLKANIKYGPGAMICFTCHFPSLNDMIHGAFKRGDEYHPFRRYVLPMAWAIYQTPKLRERAMSVFEVGVANKHDWDDPVAFARWMSDRSATSHPSSGLAIMSFVRDEFDVNSDFLA
ncbi:hypothetical protein FB107DRAFT_280398 [Schizophyllum commune]